MLLRTVFQEGRFAECIKKAERFLAVLNRYTIRDLEERDEIVAALHCYMGNCHFELEQYEEAIKAYKSDLAVSKKRYTCLLMIVEPCDII